jgi:general secretion pathway protein F
LFDDFGQELPLSTRLVLGASAWLSSYGWVLCIGLVVAIGVIATARREERVAVALDRALLSIPAVGRVHRRRQVSEHSRTLGTLLGQGIAMLPALRVAQDTLTNRAMRKRMEAVLGDVANGTQLSMALRGVNLMSPLALDIVAVGEEAGTVHHALIRVSDVYDKELSALRKRMASLLEPAVVMVLAIGLGLIVMAIMMPIFQLDVMR